ncbi:hypothetical protein [Streptomyces cavernicola]|uniref:Tat pathway signal sequence domain protein n=1 Tax=Streptomyces cavernicola TaxID=3043613 RepID=A0ABT6S7I6_9ACTN|nr:hypothetical protein [Streptomyces sp. B-S-A6]MDI3403980.1 hypothetical protein [Streptomyces sp. B-S-A6]
MTEISRRTVFVGAAASTLALGLSTSASGAEPVRAAQPSSECKELGSTQVCVHAREVQDVTGLQYVITNNGSQTMTYRVWYVDVTGGPESGKVTVTVEAGETFVGYFYGTLQHYFTLHMCDETETECVVLGPVVGELPIGW